MRSGRRKTHSTLSDVTGKVFSRRTVCQIGMAALFGLVFGAVFAGLRGTFEDSAMQVLMDTLSFGFVSFMTFSFVSYEAMRIPAEESAEESLQIYPNELLRFCGSIFLRLLCLLAAVTAGVFLLLHIPRGMHLVRSAAFEWHAAKAVILYMFFPGLIGILTGAVIQRLRRPSAYVLLIMASLFSSHFMIQAFGRLGTVEWSVASVLDWFCLIHSNEQWLADRVYGVDMEPTRWALVIFWCCALSFIFLWKVRPLRSRRRTVVLTLLAVCALLCGARFYLRHFDSLLLKDSRADGIISRENVYRYYPLGKERPAVTEAEPFSVDHYDLELKVDTKLHGTAGITLQGEVPDLCGFTLYRGYQVIRVTDQTGRELPYDRRVDWLDVTTYADTESLKITWKGEGDVFFSNRQAICLPAYFAYYPVPGHHAVWDYDHCCYAVWIPEEETDFSVTVRSGQRVYSNLPETGRNSFEGRTQAVTLIAGLVEERMEDGCRRIEPIVPNEHYVSRTVKELEASWKRYQEIFGIEDDLGLGRKTLFILPETICGGTGNGRTMAFSDQILINPWSGMDTILSAALMRTVPEHRETELLREFFTAYLNMRLGEDDPEEGQRTKPRKDEMQALFDHACEQDAAAAGREAEYAWSDQQDLLNDLLLYQVSRLGEEPVLRQVYDYLREERPVNQAAFLYSLDEQEGSSDETFSKNGPGSR